MQMERQGGNNMNNLKKSCLTLLLSLAMIVAYMPMSTITAYAKAGDVPQHEKAISSNDDGTYKLSLSVKGEAEKKVVKTNVVVVFDRSGSMDSSRMTAAKNAVKSLSNTLLSKNGQDGNPNDAFELALVTFSTNATSRGKTTSASTFNYAVDNITAEGGTNWEAALKAANSVNFGDTDQTFVIFVSDGNPTLRDTRGTTRITDNRWYNYDDIHYNSLGVYGLGSDDPNNVYGYYSPQSMGYCYDHAVDDAKAIVDAGKTFYTIGAYGNVSRMQSLTTAAGAPAANYYSAADTSALNKAMADIIDKIQTAGIADVEIDDGTPANIQVGESSTEVADLLEVEEGSFKYYKTDANGNKTEWTDIPDSCKAKNDNGTVKWNLEEAGVLENGVTYTVEFNVYPSQYTYDLIAQLKNGEKTYEELPQAVRDYLKKTGNNSYGLKTNTSATLKYDDTRNTDPAQTVSYNELDPVATDASTMAVKKDWEVPEDAKEIQMAVLQGGKDYLSVTLNEGNSWTKDPVYIAIGLMRANGNDVEVLDPGYDYSFAELGTDQYNWELDAPTVHPMLVNGTLTMLTLVDDDHPAGDAKTYKIGNNTYFESGTDKVTLNAKNYKRSTLNVKKVVDGKDAPKDATFPFTMTVNNAKAKEGKADDIKSDYYVWFSVYNGGFVERDIIGTGVQKEMKDGEWTGYYYAPSGTSLTVNLKANDNLRFLNVPTGSDYTITEGELATGFSFVNATLDPKTDGTAGRTTSGTITKTNTDYQATYNNRYDLTNVSITKKWDDNKNKTNIILRIKRQKSGGHIWSPLLLYREYL